MHVRSCAELEPFVPLDGSQIRVCACSPAHAADDAGLAE